MTEKRKAYNGEEKRTIEVYDREGKVIISTQAGNYVFEAGDAVAFADAMLTAAGLCGYEFPEPVVLKPFDVTEMQHDMLVGRTLHIVRNLDDRKAKPEYIARQVVDTILNFVSTVAFSK